MEITVKRNKIFAPCWESKCRYVCMKGSAGSGKSCDTALFYILRLLSQPGRNLLCVRKSDVSHRNSTYNELCKAIRRLGAEDRFVCSVSPLKIRCENGNEVLFGGVNDDSQREKLKSVTASSGAITDIWIEEATELSQTDFEILDDRLRGKLPDGLFYQIRLTFNPVSATHWLKKCFFDREDPNVLAHHSTYRDNAFCDEAYHQRMERRRETDPEGYRIYGLGEWGESGGLILPSFTVTDNLPGSFDSLRYGQDFGFHHANAILLCGLKDGDVYVLKECYTHEKTTDEIIALCQGWDKKIPMVCDSAEPDRILQWCRAGFRAVGVHKYPGSVKGAIDWLKQRHIYIHPSCTGLSEEIASWCYLKDQNGDFTDEVTPFHDDACAALRYAVADWLSFVPPKAQPVERPFFSRPKRVGWDRGTRQNPI